MGFTPLEGLRHGHPLRRHRPGHPRSTSMATEELGAQRGQHAAQQAERPAGHLGRVATTCASCCEAEAAGQRPRRSLALDIFCYRLRKYIGAYAASLGGAGRRRLHRRHRRELPGHPRALGDRARGMGMRIDPARNDAAAGLEADISARGRPCRMLVVPTNEELLIARDTYRIVRGLPLS